MKKPTNRITLVLATGSLLAGGAALAQPADRAERGPMTRDAVIERTDAAFARMDTNNDGVVDQADRQARMAERFSRMDGDGNGAISQAEFMAAHEQMRENRSERREARAERGGGKMMRRGGRGHRGGMLQAADANNDGRLTQAEVRTAALARFDRVDTDGDGTITVEERRAAHQARRAARRSQ